MQTFIAITQYCSVHNIDITFVQTLAEEGLISLTTEESGPQIAEEQLPDLERFTRWHEEMGINPEGMDVIRHLLHRITSMQTEMEILKRRLHLYEE